MDRRRFLRLAGGVGAAGLLAGCGEREESGTPQPTPGTQPAEPDAGRAPLGEPPADEPPLPDRLAADFDRVVDMGDATVENTDGAPIDPLLDERAGDDSVLYFPEGRYYMADAWKLNGFENFGVVGDGATVVPPDGYSGFLFALGAGGGARDLRFEGLTFDFTSQDTGARPLQARVEDGLVVRDLAVRGVQDTGQNVLRFDVTDPEGDGYVERIRLPDGGAAETPTTGCLVGPTSAGRLTFVDCQIEGFPDNGLYASPAKGPVHVLGGYFANNGIANVRVGDGAVVRGVRVVCDEAPQGFENMRGIRIRQGEDVRVENCTVDLRRVTFSDGAITVAPWVESATIRNTSVRVDADDVPALRVKPVATSQSPDDLDGEEGGNGGDDGGGGGDGRDDENGGGGPWVRCANFQITGEAADRAAIEVSDRDHCLFDGLCIRQTGADRDGIYLLRSEDTAVRNAAIDVTGQPIVVEGSDPDTSNVTTANLNGDDFGENGPDPGGSDGCAQDDA